MSEKTDPQNKSKPESTSQDASFAKSLFAGEIKEDMVFPYPKPKKEEAEMVKMILEHLHKFAAEHIDSPKIDKEHAFPETALKALGEMGLFGLQIPESYGGIGLSQMAYGRIFEEIGTIDASMATILGASQSIGLKGLLLFGNEEQKQRFLPKLATGEMLAAFALTEPGAGSDAYAIQSRAVKQSDGSYILNGNKIWITNGGVADFFVVFAKTEEEVKGKKKDRVTAFIVTRDMEGFSSGREENKMGIRGSSTTELAFTNVRIPPENLLGEPGKGFKIAMEVLNSGRLGLATGCVGGSKTSLKLATAHALERKQFGRPIAEFGLIQQKMARMTIDTYVSESIAYMTCGLVDARVPDFSVESAICKVIGSEFTWSTCNHASQIVGGNSYMQEYPFERNLRDARINMIFEGTNEILTMFIALSGMKQVGEYLKVVGDAINDPIKSFGVLYDYFVAQKISRSLYGDRITKAHPSLKREVSAIEDHVQELVGTVEKAIMKHRKKIWEKQFVLKRIARIVMHLYMMTAVVSRVTSVIEEKGEKEAEIDVNIAKAFCAEATSLIARNFRRMDRNTDEQMKAVAKQASEAGGYPTSLFA